MLSNQNESLPDFADQWMAQWKRAAEELSRIRDQELRALGHKCSPDRDASGNLDSADFLEPTLSGLVVQQQWFMRQRLLESIQSKI